MCQNCSISVSAALRGAEYFPHIGTTPYYNCTWRVGLGLVGQAQLAVPTKPSPIGIAGPICSAHADPWAEPTYSIRYDI